MITIQLTLDQVNAVLTLLGELPSKTGAWPLIVAIREQAAPQASATRASPTDNR